MQQLDFLLECEKVYVIDTSAFIQLDLLYKKVNPVFEAIWEEIEELIGNGCFQTIDFVEDEINSYQGKEEFLKKWVKKWRKRLVHETDTKSFEAAIPIINEEYNSGFFDAKKQAEGKEEADPYLIGYCKAHNFVLITNESIHKPNKLPAIARKNEVACITINDFLADRGLKMKRKSSE